MQNKIEPSEPIEPLPAASPAASHWAQTRRLSMLLFFCWLTTTFGVIYFARELSSFRLFGWPVSYYLVAQGTTLLYLAIVGIYALRMHELDRQYLKVCDGVASEKTRSDVRHQTIKTGHVDSL